MAGEEKPNGFLEEFFSSRGFRPISRDSISMDGRRPELAFTDGASTTYVRILEKTALQDRNGLLQAAVDSVSYTSVANKVYLVLPKVYAAVMDAAILRERGLGLIVYDVRGVEEVLPARLFDHRMLETNQDVNIQQLRRRISTLERTVETLNLELSKIRSARPLQVNPNNVQPIGSVGIELPKPDALPSFFQDNPWVDILTKRGKEFEQVAS